MPDTFTTYPTHSTDVLVTHSYFLRFDPKQWKTQQPYAPLATLYAASVLREAGYTVAFHDVMFARSPAEILFSLEQYRPRLLVIYDDGFNYLTKMCLTNMREAAFEMAKMAAQKGCKVIISSSDATDHTAQYLQQGADYVIIGEGEQTLPELVQALFSAQPVPENIPGLAFLRHGEMHKTARRENLRNLDALPLPAWDLVNIDTYRQRWLENKGHFSINMSTTRGCPFKCNWCAKPIYGNRYNSRTPEHVVAELKMLKARYGIDHIWFCDDIFGLKPGWISRFADLVQQEHLQIRFKIQSRVDLLLEENNIEALARAGCEEIWVGAESGSQKILDAMDKGTKVSQIYEATRLMKKKGIKPCFFLQFGYPGETNTDIDATLKMLFDLMPHDLGISVSYPLPGTVFYERVKAELREKTNWTDSDELLVMFQGTYPAGYYKKLQRYVHREFRKKQAVAALQKLVSKPATATLNDITKACAVTLRAVQSLAAKAEIKRYAG